MANPMYRLALALLVLGGLFALSVPGCGGPASMPDDDAGASDGGTCGACDDHLFCNGPEACVGGRCMAGASPCIGTQICDEARDTCTTTCAVHPDADLDGSDAIACGGDDCDDSNPTVHPGTTEVCDALGTDEDCDPSTFGMRDTDGDGHTNAGCCNGSTCGDDCDDMHADVFGGAAETCNLRDDDCDTAVDEMLATDAYYPDCDRDGYGSSVATQACAMPVTPPSCAGGVWITTTGDCDDTRATAHPGLGETCNGVDDDCNGTTDDPSVVDPICAAMSPSALHTTVACISGACGRRACDTGYDDCDGMLATGCEIDLRTHHDHCGSCSRVCGAAAVCSASACTRLIDIDAGASHTCALYEGGRAVCWGRNDDGQLGDGTHASRSAPVPVASGGTPILFEGIEAGGYRRELDFGTVDFGLTCGHDAGAVYCWGRGNEGQIGNSGTAGVAVPTVVAMIPVRGATDLGAPYIADASAGGTHVAYAQRRPRSGRPTTSVWWWGQDGVRAPSTTPVVLVDNGPDVQGATAGLHHSCWRSGDDGSVQCWGSNGNGELGDGTFTPSPTPVRATAFPSSRWAAQVAAGGIIANGRRGTLLLTGGAFTCALADNGQVYCWGANYVGQLGLGSGGPGPVVGLTDATEIAVGGRHACALRANRQVVCWGENYFGQLDGTGGPDSPTPVTVPGITTAVAIAAGGEHSCAVLADGTARCWGNDDFGQLGDGPAGGGGVVTVSGT